jgi:hypothetical protein
MRESPATLEYAFAAPAINDEPDAELSATASVALWAAFAYVVACVTGLLIMGVVMALRV